MATTTTISLPSSERMAGYNNKAVTTARTITVLLTTFAGLGLPRTLSLPLTTSTSVHDALELIYTRLPNVNQSLIITTTNNKQLLHSDYAPVESLLSQPQDGFLPLRLSARLCGGKGGFGSQLRAAGGRMSSRKKRDQNQNTNGSNRNLDGRRLRTVEQAKTRARQLIALEGKEEMDRKAKEEGLRKALDDMNSREDMIRSGKVGGDRGRLDAEYVESKEQAEEKTRADVIKNERTGSGASVNGAGHTASGSESRLDPAAMQKVVEEAARPLYGFDEDEDSEDDEDDEGDGEDDSVAVASMPEAVYIGKGKARAT